MLSSSASTSASGRISVIRIVEELRAAPAVVAHGGVVDGEEPQRLGVVDPRRDAGSPRTACGSPRRCPARRVLPLRSLSRPEVPFPPEVPSGQRTAPAPPAIARGMPGPLSLPPEDMRRLGYALVDRLVEHHETLAGSPPLRVGRRGGAARADRRPAARRARRPGGRARGAVRARAALGSACRPPPLLRPHRQPEHLRRRARRRGRRGRQRVHRVVDGRVGPVRGRPDGASTGCASWCGMPEQTAGVLTSGGSLASLTAFAAARQARLGGPARDRRRLRLRPDARVAAARRGAARRAHPGAGLRRAASGCEPAALRAAVEEDRAAGLQPFCVVATAGTTSTGAIDPLRELHAASRELGLWLHVDGAYGAPAALTAGGAAALDGLGLADSLVDRPAQVALPAVRDRLRAGARARPAGARVLARGRLPARHRAAAR